MQAILGSSDVAVNFLMQHRSGVESSVVATRQLGLAFGRRTSPSRVPEGKNCKISVTERAKGV